MWRGRFVGQTIYLRMRHRVQVLPNEIVYLADLAQIIADESIYNKLCKLPIYQVTAQDRNIVIVDVMKVIKNISKQFAQVEVQTIGPSQAIIEVIYKKKRASLPLFLLIWLLLFFGAAFAIMNFHEDVSMLAVHRKIYTMITGEETARPLLLQIPYSIGLGLGMIIFFNHVFRKRLNEEPSPLEIEMFNYQQDLDHYVAITENKESMKMIDDH